MATEADEDVLDDAEEAEDGECKSSGIEISESRSSECAFLASRSPRALATGDSTDIDDEETVPADEIDDAVDEEDKSDDDSGHINGAVVAAGMTRGQEIRGRAGVGESRAHIRDKRDTHNDGKCDQVDAANEAETKHGRNDERNVDILCIASENAQKNMNSELRQLQTKDAELKTRNAREKKIAPTLTQTQRG